MPIADESNGYKKKRLHNTAEKARKGHRGYQFATDSTHGANIERLLNRMEQRKSLMVAPVQRNPVRTAHETSPLRATASAGHNRAHSMASSAGNAARINRALIQSGCAGTAQGRRFESPIKDTTERETVKMVEEFAYLDRDVERSKHNLVAQPDFNTYDAFRMFDVDGRGVINAQDL